MKIGRNEPCPCGSGLKYKKCCLVKTEGKKLAEAVVYATQNLKREARIKQCLHPDKTKCVEKIARAHAIQNNRILSKISENGMLITMDGTSFHMFQSSDEKGRGIATTFTGFCSYHDKTLFQEIEDKEFVCSDKQIFLLTYRSMAWHYHKKQEQIRATEIQYAKMLEKGYDAKRSSEFRDFVSMLHLGNEDNSKEKEIFDAALLREEYDIVNSYIWEIPFEVEFAISMMTELEYDIEGKPINDILHARDLKKIYLNIFPCDGKSYCIWSWLKSNDSAFVSFAKQFDRLEIVDRENYFNNNLPRWSDSLVISPRLWHKWGEAVQQALITHANFDVIFSATEKELNKHAYEYMETPWNLFLEIKK